MKNFIDRIPLITRFVLGILLITAISLASSKC